MNNHDMVSNTLIIIAEFIYSIDPFIEPHILNEIRKMAKQYDDPKNFWNALHYWLNLENMPLARCMQVMGQQFCIDKLQRTWDVYNRPDDLDNLYYSSWKGIWPKINPH